MNRHLSLALMSAALLHGCSATSESVIEDAADALGDAEAIAAANTGAGDQGAMSHET
jgi:hypothetical protein